MLRSHYRHHLFGCAGDQRRRRRCLRSSASGELLEDGIRISVAEAGLSRDGDTDESEGLQPAQARARPRVARTASPYTLEGDVGGHTERIFEGVGVLLSDEIAGLSSPGAGRRKASAASGA